MYQINIPAIYNELTDKNMASMKKILVIGSFGAAFAYILAGMFGWVSFAATPDIDKYKEIFDAQNILMAPYGAGSADGQPPVVIYICLYGILIVVSFATPFCVLPTKDSIEEVRGGSRLTKKENFWYTALIVAVCCAISSAVLSIGTVMTILGATTNSAIGFLLPIAFYLKVEKRRSKWTNDKIIAYLVFVFICISSVIELTTFILKTVNGNGDDN